MSVQERKTSTAGIAVAGLPGHERVYAVRDGTAVPWDALVAARLTEIGADGVRRHGRAGLFDGALEAMARISVLPTGAAVPVSSLQHLRPPFERHPSGAFATGKILALGRSYRAHALELGNAPLERPIVFGKLPEAMVGSGSVINLPPDAEGKMDHEAELAFVLGSDALNLAVGEGLGRVGGYFIANDLTLRTIQTAAKKAGHPWLRAKNFPGAMPVGPWLTPAAFVGDPGRLVIRCTVNGETRQHAPVSQMTWDVGRTVEELSRLWPLQAGDIVSTGTPAGVSGLNPGDVCEIEISSDEISLGTLSIRVASA